MSHTVDGRAFIADLLSDGAKPAPAPARAGAAVEFTVRRFVLQQLLDKAATVIPSRDVMPVLKNFQIEVTHARLRIVATDLELSMISTTDLVDVAHPGVIVMPARKMLDIVREAEHDAQVHVRVEAGTGGATAAVTIGRTTWNLRLQSGLDYPPMPEITDVTFTTVDRAAFAAGLASVRYAACKDANRASLMMIDVNNGRMTACDGSRFQQATVPDLPFSCQIPIGAVDDLVKLLRNPDVETIRIGHSDNHIIFTFGADVFIVNKLFAPFPDMEALLLRPALENRHTLSVDRTELLTAIKRIRINADPETSAIALALQPGKVTVQARDKFGNTAAETVDADWEGPERTIVVNHQFLTDMVGPYDGTTCTFFLGEDTRARRSPLLLRNDDAGTVGVVQQMLADWVGQ